MKPEQERITTSDLRNSISLENTFFVNFFVNFNFVPVCIGVCAHGFRCQNLPEVLDPLELEL